MSMAVGDRDENEPMMDMNTTPLIDVMLVLLIMFIITIPVQTHAVKIDLPVPNENPSNVDPQKNKVMIDIASSVSSLRLISTRSYTCSMYSVGESMRTLATMLKIPTMMNSRRKLHSTWDSSLRSKN